MQIDDLHIANSEERASTGLETEISGKDLFFQDQGGRAGICFFNRWKCGRYGGLLLFGQMLRDDERCSYLL